MSLTLAIKRASLINDRYIIRPTLIDLNPIELDFFPFMVSLDKSDRCCR